MVAATSVVNAKPELNYRTCPNQCWGRGGGGWNEKDKISLGLQ